MSSLFDDSSADKKLQRRNSDVETVGSFTTAYSSKGSNGYSSKGSTGSSSTAPILNVWNRLLSSESVWDSLNVVKNQDNDEEDEDEDLLYIREFQEKKKWYHHNLSGNNVVSVICLTAWYEVRHFLKTMASHPHIWLTSLAVACAAAGVGMWAVNAEKRSYVDDRMKTAEFIATDTAMFFSNEFKRAFIPLYSLREAVSHSGYFDDLAYRIGRYPHLRKEDNATIPGGLANLRDVVDICDGERVLEKWGDLVSTSTHENDLDGLITRYRLMPRNVACLDYKGNKAASDNGMDMSNSNHPYWSMVVRDLFINRWEGLHTFGPFKTDDGKEMFCTHLAIWDKPNDKLGLFPEEDGEEASGTAPNSYTNILGTEVENAWGFVMNYLDWGELKKRSDIHECFAKVNMEFELTRQEEDIDPDQGGPRGEQTKEFPLLAKSEKSHLLDDSNSIVVETESLHGIWHNRVGIASGWNPEWWWPAVASVIIISLLLGLLTASTLVKSQLHRELTEKMIPKKAIKKLHRGQTVVEKYNLVTIFYADVVGFKSKAGRAMDPVQVMDMLNDMYNELDKIAERHGVYKVETVGNRYLVVGGVAKQESARAAAKRVALFAIDVMAFVDNGFLTASGDRLFVRAGMSSGPAVAGCVGKAVPRYCFFGETMDRALRLEKTSNWMKIQCCEVSQRLLLDASGMKFVMKKRMVPPAGAETLSRGNQVTYWIEKASPCENCLELADGSWILDPCGHVLCAECNKRHSLNVCPTCRCEVGGRSEWKREGPSKILDSISNASFDLEVGPSDLSE